MKRPMGLRLINLIILILLILSFLIYFFPNVFSQIHQGNFFSWFIHQTRRHPFLSFWIWILSALFLFLILSTLKCISSRFKKGRRCLSISLLFHLGFVLAFLGFCLDGMVGVKGIEMHLNPGKQMAIPGFPEMSLQLEDIKSFEGKTGRGSFPGMAQGKIILRRGDKVLKENRAFPNHPLIYRGMAAYLIQFREGWTGIRMRIDDHEIELKPGEEIPLKEHPYRIRLDRLVPHLGIGRDGQVFSQSQAMLNPAAQISLLPTHGKEEAKTGWIFQRFEHMNPLSEKGIKAIWISNLKEEEGIVHFGHHPGLGLIIAALILGLMGTLFLIFGLLRSPEPEKVNDLA
ncbi:MAG: hypothetical protein ACMUIM_04710 [bacterium]